MASHALYAEYTKDVWYPPFSGVRQKIDRIFAKHPKGFQRMRAVKLSPEDAAKKKYGYSLLRQNLDQGVDMSGNAAFDLAEIELDKVAERRRRKSHHGGQLAETLATFQGEMDDLDLSDDDDEDDGDD